MILEVQTGTDNPILRKKSVEISQFDKKLKKLAKDLIETMIEKDGVGLAAPQVGINERIVILNLQLGEKKSKALILVNPKITSASAETEIAEEGCLSLPKIFEMVKRNKTVVVKFQDEKGKSQTLELADLNARAAQHEIDHLDGILFVDKIEK